MKKVQWLNRNRMIFNSLHKTYNKTVQAITTGNVIDDGYLSSYIRPYIEVDCNSHKFELGHLQDYDLKSFSHLLPSYIIKQIKELTHDQNAILYVFRHYNNRRAIVHGAILTESPARDNKLIKKWYINRSYKSESVIDEALPYITN